MVGSSKACLDRAGADAFNVTRPNHIYRIPSILTIPMAGREIFPVKFVLGITEEMRVKIDEWRRTQTDIPSRSEAIRRLLEEALKRSRP